MSTSKETYDVIVIGGGASGMMAAGKAGERGKRVLLLEKNEVLGKKLSITGGGRCNITNAEFDTRTLLKNYGDAEVYLFSPFSQFGVQNTFDFFESHGLPLVIEERKRAFPRSESALDVTRTLETCMKRNYVTVMMGVTVQGFDIQDGTIVGVQTDKGTFRAKSYVLATGGRSHAHTGSTGEGLEWVAKLGHRVHESNPDVVPLSVCEDWVKRLSGKSLINMKITFGEGKNRISRVGGLLFTHFGISGPLVLNVAREVKKLLKNGEVVAHIDLFPKVDTGELRKIILAHFELHKNKALKNIMKDMVPPGMSEAVLAQLDANLWETKVHSISKEERNALVDIMKALPFTITGTMGYEWAVVSDGGIDLREVDTKTMASKLHPNLYFTGDVLNISRPSGGFSLQLCWTSGWVAANNV